MFRRLASRPYRSLSEPSAGSVVIALVAVSRMLYIRAGLPSRLSFLTLAIIAVRKSCWRSIRWMSLPSPRLLRTRTKPRACSPLSVTSPAGTWSLAAWSSIGCSRWSGTPPRASTSFLKPTKSTVIWWSTRTPVRCSTVFIVQAVPPTLIALLNMPKYGSDTPPPGFWQAGTSTIRSRGKLTPSAVLRPSGTCSRIVVSDRCARASAGSLPYSALSPARVSLPTSRMLSAPVGSGRSLSPPSFAAKSSVLMLLSSRS